MGRDDGHSKVVAWAKAAADRIGIAILILAGVALALGLA